MGGVDKIDLTILQVGELIDQPVKRRLHGGMIARPRWCPTRFESFEAWRRGTQRITLRIIRTDGSETRCVMTVQVN
jgi:hypothetical protein